MASIKTRSLSAAVRLSRLFVIDGLEFTLERGEDGEYVFTNEEKESDRSGTGSPDACEDADLREMRARVSV